jgi:hypothetical protein
LFNVIIGIVKEKFHWEKANYSAVIAGMMAKIGKKMKKMVKKVESLEVCGKDMR